MKYSSNPDQVSPNAVVLSDKTLSKLKKEGLLWRDFYPFSIMIIDETRIKDFTEFMQKIERIISSTEDKKQKEKLLNIMVYGLVACDTYDDPDRLIKFITKFQSLLDLGVTYAPPITPVTVLGNNIVKCLAYNEKWHSLEKFLEYCDQNRVRLNFSHLDVRGVSDLKALIINFAPSKIVMQYLELAKKNDIEIDIDRTSYFKYSLAELIIIFGRSDILEYLKIDSHRHVVAMLKIDNNKLLDQAGSIMEYRIGKYHKSDVAEMINAKNYNSFGDYNYVRPRGRKRAQIKATRHSPINNEVDYDISLRNSAIDLIKRIEVLNEYFGINKYFLSRDLYQEIIEIPNHQIFNLQRLLRDRAYSDQYLIDIIAGRKDNDLDIPVLKSGRFLPIIARGACFSEEIKGKTKREVIKYGIDMCKNRQRVVTRATDLILELARGDLPHSEELDNILEQNQWLEDYKDKNGNDLITIFLNAHNLIEAKNQKAQKPDRKVTITSSVDQINKKDIKRPSQICSLVSAALVTTTAVVAGLILRY